MLNKALVHKNNKNEQRARRVVGKRKEKRKRQKQSLHVKWKHLLFLENKMKKRCMYMCKYQVCTSNAVETLKSEKKGKEK